MTIPSERCRSVSYAREFLEELADPKKTHRIPKSVRDRARRLLRHYPSDYDMEMAAKASPDIFTHTGR